MILFFRKEGPQVDERLLHETKIHGTVEFPFILQDYHTYK